MIITLANISPMELLWSASGIISLTILLAAVGQAWRVYRTARARPKNALQTAAAWQEVRHALERALLQSAFLLIGVVAMATPPPVRAPLMLSALIDGIALTLCQIILVASSLRDQQVQRQLIAALRERRREVQPNSTPRHDDRVSRSAPDV